MSVYIRLNDVVEAFKKAKEDDEEQMISDGIFDSSFTFDAYRAIDIIDKCHKYLIKGEV